MNEVNISDSFERNNENDKYWRELRDRSIKRKCKCKIRSVFNFSLEFYIYSLAKILLRELHLYAYLLTTNWERGCLQVKDKTNSTSWFISSIEKTSLKKSRYGLINMFNLFYQLRGMIPLSFFFPSFFFFFTMESVAKKYSHYQFTRTSFIQAV